MSQVEARERNIFPPTLKQDMGKKIKAFCQYIFIAMNLYNRTFFLYMFLALQNPIFC